MTCAQLNEGPFGTLRNFIRSVWSLINRRGNAVLLLRKAMKGLKGFLKLKGFKVSVISSNPPCKDGNARFTAAPLKASSYHA